MLDSSPKVELVQSRSVIIKAGQQRLLFDPNKVPKYWQTDTSIACISHAHADHTGGLVSPITKIATSATFDIYKALGGKLRRTHAIALGDSVDLIDGGRLHVEPAGHMLGAVQFVVDRADLRLVYTGDFNLSSSLTAKGATPIPCDYLLMEATYGRPGAVFPSRETVYTEIVEWASRELKERKIPVFEVYGTGKAQEITKVLNRFLTTPVIVDDTVAKVNEIYRENGIPLIFHSSFSTAGQEIMRQGDYVFISSRRIRQNRAPSGQRLARATATGWAQLYPLTKVDKAFVLSAHADFSQLVQYVQEAKPKAVYLTCGDVLTFGAVLEKLGIKRIVPRRKRQLLLSDFL